MRLLLPLLLLLLRAWAVPGDLGERAPLSATAPQLDEEEKYSAHMPVHLRCDACMAVAYQESGFCLSLPGPSFRHLGVGHEVSLPDVATSGKGGGQASHPGLQGAAGAERVGIHRRPGPELLPDLEGLRGTRSEPGETSHGPRAKQGARARHQCDDHRGPLAHQALRDMFSLPGGVWRRPDL
uniref:Marginal zone B and B1 cell specific protein n=1 Tax=Equus caballus TaxID=9796 RepID=F7DZJ8_HORSE